MSVIVEKKIKFENHKAMKFTVEMYNSAMEVVDDCKEREITDCNFHDMRHYSIDEDWHGVGSYEQALDFMRNGYQPTVEKLKASLKINAQGNGKRFKMQNNTVGFAPVVPLAMKGIPNCMLDMQMKPIKQKVIDVYYDMVQPAGVSPQDIIRAGQKLLGVIIELERQGYRFNLYALQSYSESDSADILSVRVKTSNQPIDLKRISFPLTHVGFFRVIGFDWYSKCPKAKYRCAYGHYLASELRTEKDQKAFAKQMFGENAIYISGKLLNSDENHIKEVLTNGK